MIKRIFAPLVLILISLSGCQKIKTDSDRTELISVKVAPVREQVITEEVELSGTVIAQPNRSARVTSPVQGCFATSAPM